MGDGMSLSAICALQSIWKIYIQTQLRSLSQTGLTHPLIQCFTPPNSFPGSCYLAECPRFLCTGGQWLPWIRTLVIDGCIQVGLPTTWEAVASCSLNLCVLATGSDVMKVYDHSQYTWHSPLQWQLYRGNSDFTMATGASSAHLPTLPIPCGTLLCTQIPWNGMKECTNASIHSVPLLTVAWRQFKNGHYD